MELTIDQSRELADLIQRQYSIAITALNLQINPTTFSMSSEDSDNVIGKMGRAKINKWYYGSLSYNRLPVEEEGWAMAVMQGEECILAYQGEGDGNEDTREGMLFNYLSISSMKKGINLTFSGVEVIAPEAEFICPADATWGINPINALISQLKEEASEINDEMSAQDEKCKEAAEANPIPNGACSQAEDSRAEIELIERKLKCLEALKKDIDEAEAAAAAAAKEAAEIAERRAEEQAEADFLREAENAEQEDKQRSFTQMATHGMKEGFPQYGFTCPFLTEQQEFDLMDSTMTQRAELEKELSELKMKIEKTVKERGEEAAIEMGLFNTEETYKIQLELLEERGQLIKECRKLSGDIPRMERPKPEEGEGKRPSDVFDPAGAEPFDEVIPEEGEGGKELPEPPPAEEEGKE